MFAEDGILYREESLQQFTFTFNNKSDIQSTLDTSVEAKIKEAYARQFYYLKYGTKDASTLTATWNSTTTSTNTNTGYFKSGGPLVIGDSATSNMKFAKPGALIKFTSPDTRKFLNGTLVTSTTDNSEDRLWAKIGAVVLDGANTGLGNLESGIGPVTLNNIVPDGAVINAIIPNLTTSFATTLESDLIARIEAYEEFGLRYDTDSETWKVITSTNLSTSSVFSLANTGSATGTNADASWWFKIHQ